MRTEFKEKLRPSIDGSERKSLYRRYIKRPMDLILSLMGIVVLSPVFIIIAILVKLKLGSPVLFKQKRPGFNEEIFIMYKFRTMTDERDKCGSLLADSARLTNFGKSLRSTSLDELPELFNILKGDMSIVGPRPQLVRDMVFMSSKQKQRHLAYPGLTGLAQVNGRNNITWEDKILLDLEYIENITFIGDLKIIFKTVYKVFKKDDIYSKDMDTAEDLGDYLLRIGKVNELEYEEKQELSRELLRKVDEV